MQFVSNLSFVNVLLCGCYAFPNYAEDFDCYFVVARLVLCCYKCATSDWPHC